MKNEPQVKIEYLVNYDLTFINDNNEYTGSELNTLANIEDINNQNAKLKGKKGLHLSGGSVDENTGEVSGCLLDGTYTFYSDSKRAYDGIMGNELCADDYSFTSQYIDFKTKSDNTFIRSIIIYFDPIASEFATQISFSNAVNADGKIDESITSATKIKNNGLIFMYNFGENSKLKSVRANIEKWSKKNALMKILKIVTGYTGVYGTNAINSLSYSRNKFSDSDNLKFGVSLQDASLEILDKDYTIKALYENNLFYKNIKVNIYMDDIMEASYYLKSKDGNNSTNVWTFSLNDILTFKLNEKVPAANIPTDSEGNIISKPLTWFISFAVSNSLIIKYEEGLEDELNQIIIPIPFVRSGQTRYDLLLKCCQAGLLRMYADKFGNLIISRGI